jgi:hypothetical protein
VRFLRRPFLPDGDWPFPTILSAGLRAHALTAIHGWLDRIFSPRVTLGVFLGQVLRADPSCRAAVARWIAPRLARGQSPCAAETGADCQARKRRPEAFFADVARQTGRAREARGDPKGLWKRRHVSVEDGSSVSLLDTPENPSEYPQPVVQKPGRGFPLAPIAAGFSRAGGAVLDRGLCRYAGKGPSELGMRRTWWELFLPGAILLADGLLGAWTETVMLKQRGVDGVCRWTSHRQADCRRGQRLGPDDHRVLGPTPTKPRSIDRETADALPAFLRVGAGRVRVKQPGFRVATLRIATTLLAADEFTKDDLTNLYRARWNAARDLRSLKQTLPRDVLRCKTPELVRKELGTHIRADKRIRTSMAQAASNHGIEPRSISFQGALQTREAFQPVMALVGDHDAEFRQMVYEQLLEVIAGHRVADRPNR